MARPEHHAAYAFLSYYLLYSIFIGQIIPGWAVFLVIFFGIFPDFDGLYWIIKKKGEINTEFQHHLYYWTHWPLSYIPCIIIFFLSLTFNFYPIYFLIPVVGIYCGHLIPDSISTGDGVMWGKIPWKKKRYARYINLFSNKTDGYHGHYWEARYRTTITFKIGRIASIFSLIILVVFLFYSS
ncbi:MAG: metal-dependent hydrolase, partial [Promethearchaeota archaeon]